MAEVGRGSGARARREGSAGRAKPKGLDLEKAATRANMVAAIESALAAGISGVQLDIEPYPTGPGFIALLEELDASFARLGFHGRLSVVAPAETSTWVIPCYAPDSWHDPAVENIATATSALAAALTDGSRVNGAGIWWWYAFFYEDHGHFKTTACRSAWQLGTVELPFSP